MFDKMISKIVLVTFICFFASACTTARSSKDSMSSEEQAALNLQLGVRYLDMGMLRDAKDKLEMALDLDSKNDATYNALGALHERLQQDNIAKEYYQDGLSISSNNASLANNYGRLLCESGDHQAGIVLLKQAVSMPLNTRKWFAYTNLGRCELMSGEERLAESYLRQALQLNSSYSAALLEMQEISYKAGKYMSSRAFLERYLAVAKQRPETLWYGMQTEKALGNEKLSDKYRNMLLTLFPASKEAMQLKTSN